MRDPIVFMDPGRVEDFLRAGLPQLLVLPKKEFTPRLRELATNATFIEVSGVDTAQFKRWNMIAVIRR